MDHRAEFNQLRTRLSNIWLTDDRDRQSDVSLCIVQGLIERTRPRTTIGPSITMFLTRQLDLIRTDGTDPILIENEATALGLGTCNPEEAVTRVQAYFGSVEEVSGHRLRIVLLDEYDSLILDDREFPAVWVPKNFREAGAAIAWIQRQYDSGTLGRFEPGGCLD